MRPRAATTAAAASALLVACCLGVTAAGRWSHDAPLAPPPAPTVAVDVDLGARVSTPPLLYGAFFEEIQHAGDGGLYAEMVRDRSAGGLARVLGLADSAGAGAEVRLPVGYGVVGVEEGWRPRAAPAWPPRLAGGLAGGGGVGGPPPSPLPPRAWRPLAGTAAFLNVDASLPPAAGPRRLALRARGITPPLQPQARNATTTLPTPPASNASAVGVANGGYWGFRLEAGGRYALVAYLRVAVPGGAEAGGAGGPPHGPRPAPRRDPHLGVVVTLSLPGSADAAAPHLAAAHLAAGAEWARVDATLRIPPAACAPPAPGGPSPCEAAELGIALAPGAPAGAELWVGAVSLFPAANGPLGCISPFRQDLLALLRGLSPAFLRVPGGCYTEGVTLADAFDWRTSVAPPLARPGHWNGPWEYWSTDGTGGVGMGMFEYLSLAAELGAEPVWVASAGVAHTQSLPTSVAGPLVASALDALAFANADAASSPLGALRAAMGREAPFKLSYLAIGNEDCGKPFYLTNYASIAAAVLAAHPGVRVISNCPLGGAAPAAMHDWHWYADADSVFAGRAAFDAEPRGASAAGPIFASEYAAFDWGIPTSPAGNLKGALAEAAFLTGVAANADVVVGSAFAPLFVHARAPGPCPTSLVVFDGGRAFPTPSYHVQAAFARAAGVALPRTVATGPGVGAGPAAGQPAPGPPRGLAAAAFCANASCAGEVTVHLVNYSPAAVPVRLALGVRGAVVPATPVAATLLTAPSEFHSNSFAHPDAVAPAASALPAPDPAGGLAGVLPPWALAVWRVRVDGRGDWPAPAVA